jgi:signal transduction histidine kinase
MLSRKTLQKTKQEIEEHDTLRSELIDMISHELRTPMCIFKNIVSNALAGTMGAISPKLKENLIIADKEIDRLAKIVNDFVDIAQIDNEKMELRIKQFSMQSAVNTVLQSLSSAAAAKNLKLITETPDNDLRVEADYTRIARVLTNLITNAIKFTAEGGRVVVRLKDLDTDIFIEVEDNGIGIPEDAISKIFSRFVQIEKFIGPGNHGTGLGLSVARSFVEMHGGRIWAESTVGRGSSFCIALPKSQSLAESPDNSNCFAAV